MYEVGGTAENESTTIFVLKTFWPLSSSVKSYALWPLGPYLCPWSLGYNL